MAWTLFIAPAAERALRKLPKAAEARLRTAILRLADDPFAAALDVKKLSGSRNWRLRVGDYRVIYFPDGKKLVVLVIDVSNRREAYR